MNIGWNKDSSLFYKLNVIYSWFSLPALILHEASHYVTGLFVGYHFSLSESYTQRHRNGSFMVALAEKNHKKIFWKSLIVSLAPLYFVIATGVGAIFCPFCRYVFAYLLLAWFYSLPSTEDWRKIRYHTLYEKYLDDQQVMSRFFSLKGYYKYDENEDLVLEGPDDL